MVESIENGVLLHKNGLAIKAVPRGNGLLEGYLVSFGGPNDADLEGQWFTPRTDFRLDYFADRPVLYHHGLDSMVGLNQIGRIKSINADDIGLWVQAQLNLADRYGREVFDMVQTKPFGWSSGSIDHLVKIAPDGEIQVWPIFEGSVTPTPAQPRKTTVRALKAILGNQHPVFAAFRGRNDKETQVAGVDTAIKTTSTGVSDMKLKRSTVLKVLKRYGFKADEVDAEAIATDIENDAMLADDDFATLDDDLEGMPADDDFATLDDDLDAMLADDDFATLDDDLDAMLADDDFATLDDDLEGMLADDDFATLDDDLEGMLADDDFATLDDDLPLMRSRKRRAPAPRRRAKSAGSTALAIIDRRLRALELGAAPGEATVGYKSVRVTRDVADQPGAYKSAFTKYIARGQERMTETERYVLFKGEQRFAGGADTIIDTVGMKALITSDAGSVGFAVPEDVIAELNRNVMVDAVTAAECKVRNTTSDTVTQPDLVTTDARRAFPGSAHYPGESPATQAEHQVTDMTLAKIQIPVHVMLISTYASYTSLEDVSFDLSATISEQFAEIIAVEYEKNIWGGNGVGKMRGIVNDTRVTGSASSGVQTVSGYLPTGKADGFKDGDPIVKMIRHLPPAYRKRAKFVMNSNTASVVETLKDGQGRYLWGDETLNGGSRDTLRGVPVIFNEFSDDIAPGAFPILLADLSRAYLIAKRVEFSLRRFDDSATALQDNAFFVGRARIGGQVVLPAAIKSIKIAVS